MKIFIGYPENPALKYVTAHVSYVNKDVSKLSNATRYFNPQFIRVAGNEIDQRTRRKIITTPFIYLSVVSQYDIKIRIFAKVKLP